MTEVVNAKITGTHLGIEDHGILTFFLYLEFDGYHQGFGGYALDTYDKENKMRIGTAYGTDCILNILKVLEVNKWEDLKGKYVRIKRDGTWNEPITEIGHIVNNKWFNIKELADKHFKT
jgi:hypothetical protein